jgi:hypothetical protein
MERVRRRRREGRLLLALTLLVALLARAHELGLPSLWVDEAFSAWVTTFDPAEIWRIVPRFDTHPPLYYALLDSWTALFGDGEASLRALSVLFAVATVPLVYLSGRALAPTPAGAPRLGGLAAALFALAPFQIAYAQEARSYAALVTAAAVAFLGALRLLGEPDPAGVPWLGWGRAAAEVASAARRARLAWGFLVAGWASCLWLHNLGLLVLAASFPPLFLWWSTGGREGPNRSALANLALAALLAVLVWLPNLPGLLGQVGEVTRSFWLPPPSAATVARALRRLFTLDRLGGRDPWPLLLALEVWGVVWLARNGRGGQALFLAAVPALAILAALAVSFTLVPVFLDRTMIWVELPGYLALAAGVLGLPRPGLRLAGTVLVLAGFGWAAATYHARKAKEPWRDVARDIAAERQAGDEIAVAPPYGAKAIGYYLRRGDDGEGILVPRWEDPTEGLERPDYERRLIAARRVWLVTRTEDAFDPRRYWVTERLEAQRPRLKRLEYDDRLGLELFGPPREGQPPS